MLRRALITLAVVAVGAASLSPPAQSQAPEPPILHGPVARGVGIREAAEPIAPVPRRIDGRIDDWIGEGTGFGGTAVYSAGEFVYTDYIFDAYGADDGGDAGRARFLDPLSETAPAAARMEHLQQQSSGDLGVPAVQSSEHYGNAGYREAADLLEFRVGADRDNTYFLARTTTMTRREQAAVLILVDTGGPPREVDIPFRSGIRSSRADVAIFLADGAGRAVDLRTGRSRRVPVGVNTSGYTNAIEAVVGRAMVERNSRLRIAVATGIFDRRARAFQRFEGVDANLVNVAFRTDEPVRAWMDRRQGLALGAGSIDPFAVTVDVRRLLRGDTEVWRPGPGYHERIFVSRRDISSERGLDGIHQHYGLYVPRNLRTPSPLTFWMHWRGGKAHSAATISPRIMRDHGEGRRGIVVSPRGRGTSTWTLGKGMVDFHEVWDDVFGLFPVDENRVYMAGHSLGGWASYLLPILYPDRFAGTMPVAAPVTQGAWTGADFDGCDEFRYDDGNSYTPCYVASNDGDPRTQHTRRLLENLRNVPVAVYQGALDELVPTGGVVRQVERLMELGYRHRFYLFPTYEHYSHPVVDEWAEGVRYLNGFRRDPSPAHVTYVRDMAFERSVEQGPSQFESPTAGISFDFDSAYWMSGLTPSHPNGVARFDGRSLALTSIPATEAPEAGGPASLGQTGPYVMTGLQWAPAGSPPRPRNAFEVTLSGARSVRLDMARMRIDSGRRITARVATDSPLRLTLSGAWAEPPLVVVNGRPANVEVDENGALVVPLRRGRASIVIR